MEERSGPTRRQLLRRLGVGAGVAWVAPAILSQPASAADGTHHCARCRDFFGSGGLDKFACGGAGCACLETTSGPACIDTNAGFFPATDPADCTSAGLYAFDISCVAGPGAYFCVTPCPP